MDFQTQNNNIRGMNFATASQQDEEDDLIFDPVLERKRIADGTEEYLEELRRDWEKYASGKNSFPDHIAKISFTLREWMLSFDRTNFYDRLAREFDLQGSDRMGIARLAWDIVLQAEWSPRAELFQKHISKASVISELAKRFATDFIPKARELSLMADARPNALLPRISRSAPTEQKTIDRVEISLMQALGKFEKLGGQQVTNSKIVVKGQNDPVRPTIFNWLRAYRDELGVGAHDAVARGQFLFHSLNGKGLSSDERDQVGMLLKSLDENSPLTIDAGRQEVVFGGQRTEGAFSNSGRTALEAERPLQMRTTVVPPAGGASAVRGAVLEPNTFQTAVAPLKSGTTAPERLPDQTADAPLPTQGVGNISRAVFDLPVMNHGMGNNPNSGLTAPEAKQPLQVQTAVAPLKSGTTAPANRPSAFEQAKAIQQANRESRLSISNLADETVELGRMDVPREEIRPVAVPRPSAAPALQSVVPAPRAISFEPAKIDTFSFGIGTAGIAPSPRIAVTPPAGGVSAVREEKIENSGLTAPKAERPLFADDGNVGALSFSTNHVMPAEKEASRIAVIPPAGGVSAVREQGIENSGLRQLTDQKAERPLPRQTADDTNSGRTADKISGTTAQSAPVKQAPTLPPVNRFRITPTGHRDTVASDDTPSPHVVDLRS